MTWNRTGAAALRGYFDACGHPSAESLGLMAFNSVAAAV
jgi:hypothetical protein